MILYGFNQPSRFNVCVFRVFCMTYPRVFSEASLHARTFKFLTLNISPVHHFHLTQKLNDAFISLSKFGRSGAYGISALNLYQCRSIICLPITLMLKMSFLLFQ